MAMGKWDTTINIFNLPYKNDMKILGIYFTSTTDRTAELNWSITGQIKSQAREAYTRNLNIVKRIKYIHYYLLAKVWFRAQILPLTEEHRRQIETATTWYLWRGSVFRVPISTLQRSKQQGGWNLININTKCRALMYYRLTKQRQQDEIFTANWLRKWDLTVVCKNPPT
jgi:hypothetical protein